MQFPDLSGALRAPLTTPPFPSRRRCHKGCMSAQPLTLTTPRKHRFEISNAARHGNRAMWRIWTRGEETRRLIMRMQQASRGEGEESREGWSRRQKESREA